MKNRKGEDLDLELNGQAQKGFSLLVTHRHPRTGQIIKEDPYIKRVVGEIGSAERSTYWERPAGSGNLFNRAGEPIGRWEYEEKTIKGKRVKQGRFVEGAAHVEWTPPETQDQKIARENAALKAELAALKSEKEKSATTQKKDKGA